MWNNSLYSEHGNVFSEDEFLNLNLDDVFIIDVRNLFEQGGGYLQCSHNIPFTELLHLPDLLPKDKIILTYCNYGNRAGRSAKALSEAGYKAYSLGGYSLFSAKIKKKCADYKKTGEN